MKAIGETFKEFAGQTKLHGIARISEGKLLWKLFWTILVIISICMAFSDLVRLVNQYQSEPTALRISLANTTVNWPSPTLCMEILDQYIDSSWGSLYEKKTANWPIVWDSPELGLNDSHQYFEQFYNLVNAENYTEVSYVHVESNPNILYYNYMMLGYLTEFEEKLVGGEMFYLKENQFNLAYNDPLVAGRVLKFYEFYRNYHPDVTIPKLIKAFGMYLCLQQMTGVRGLFSMGCPINPKIYGQFENYRYFGDPNYISLPLCKANMITHLGFGMVCSKVFESRYVPFVPDYDYFAIYDTHMTHNFHMIDTNQGPMPDFISAKLINNFRWHLDIEGRNVVPLEDRKNVFSWNPGDHVVVDISVATEYRFLNRKISPCSTAVESQYQCQWRKRVDFVVEQCGCWPSLADIRSQRNNISCSNYDYMTKTFGRFPQINNLSTSMLPCGNILDQVDTSECLPDCHLVNNRLTQQLTKKLYKDRIWTVSDGTNIGSLEFRYTLDSHNSIEEITTLRWSTFLGTWGGSIGTWLGASLLAFIHVPIYLVRQWL